MNFLAPLFLFGAAAVALPVLFHLIRRAPREQRVFSSLMFLQASPPRLTKRSRLEHLLLLLLRCGVLCLLSLGFARPFFKKPVSDTNSAAAKRILLLVDSSASMQRADLWSDAKKRVDKVFRESSPLDQIALCTFDRQVKSVVTFDQWTAAPPGDRATLIANGLASITPGWSGTHLGAALITAAEMTADTSGKPATGPREVVLITDLQEGCRLEPLQGYEWPKGLELKLEPVKALHSSNASVQLLADPESSGASGESVRVRISNGIDSKREQFKLGWLKPEGSDFAEAPIEAYVPPGQMRTFTLPWPGSGLDTSRIRLQGDEETFDNTVYVTKPEASQMTILYIGSEPENDPKQQLYFLRHAFQDTRHQTVRILNQPPGKPLPPEASSATLLVVTEALAPEMAAALREQVSRGKSLLFVVKTDGVIGGLALLLGIDRLGAGETHAGTYSMLTDIDFHHPLFAPFVDPRFSDFTKIHFWRYRKVDPTLIPGARILAKFDGGDPALLEIPLGRGRVIVLTSGWQPQDSQLALSTKFVPLLYSMLLEGGVLEPARAVYQVGDAVPIPPEMVGAALVTPAGSQQSLAAGVTNFSGTMMPGIYTMSSGGHSKRFAVNLDAAESRITPLPVDALERLGAPVTHEKNVSTSEAEKKIHLKNGELEARQKLWRWFLVITMSLLLCETWLAGRTWRRSAVPEGATS